MLEIRRQFFFSYAAVGSVMPLITVFLREQGSFGYFEIGAAMSLMGLPMLCSPALITLLADRHLDTRRILAVAYSCSAVVLSILFFSKVLALTLTLFFFHGLASVAMIPLQDGYFFSLVEERRRRGEASLEYPKIRIWGTVGYILPSLLLFYPLLKGAEARTILPCAVFFCLLSLANSFTLPTIARVAKVTAKRLPSKDAFAAIISPRARWLSIGLLFALLAAASYYSFIANYLHEVVGIGKPYIGLIINLGVVVEVGCTLLMPWLHAKIHLKGILVLGLGCMVARMLLLAFFPTPWVAVFAQLGHGFEVLALYIGPVMFLNRLAEDEFRNSIQGVYTMAVAGSARVVGSLLAGTMAASLGLKANLLLGAALATCGWFIIAFLFSRIPPRAVQKEIEVSPLPLP